MKQQQLEQLVERLAEAERTAAERIMAAKNESNHRLEALRQRLEQQHRQEIEEQQAALEQETRAQNAQLKARAQKKSEAADRQIKRIEARHERNGHALIRWLVTRVTPP